MGEATLMCPSQSVPNRRALTLVEMLVSLVCVLLLMLAYTQLFSSVGTRITEARSMIDLTNRMRSAASRLRTDLAGHTCDLIPPQNPASGDGYFEYIEGPLHDKPGENGLIADATSGADSKFLGDTDDVLMFTVRSKDAAFTGHYNSTPVQSQIAEVVWFLRPTMLVDPSSSGTATVPASPPTFTLYRHTYLVLPTYQGNPTAITATPIASALLPNTTFYQNNDISVHYDLVAGNFVPNSLGDLAKRECRFGHNFVSNASSANGFPHQVNPGYLVPFGGALSSGSSGTYSVVTSNARYGEDVLLTNVVSFDVQAWDPTAPVYTSSTTPPLAVTPTDPGFPYPTSLPTRTLADLAGLVGNPSKPQPSNVGAFVDLNWFNLSWDGTASAVPWSSSSIGGPATMSPFYSRGRMLTPPTALNNQLLASAPSTFDINNSWMFGNAGSGNPATYDTWSTHYEHDGINQVTGGTTNADPSSSGFQDNANYTETSPPYPVPLRGIKITIRCYEPDSRQMHEVSVVESFVPQ
jgi:hypothetical protein